ncbi:hypothetical protein FOA52_003376 [Chlamydomonas sp. UWO 241]|nr:hypothetical protein FOA52_003376 [Chlamydomonas sp. UWO 241]
MLAQAPCEQLEDAAADCAGAASDSPSGPGSLATSSGGGLAEGDPSPPTSTSAAEASLQHSASAHPFGQSSGGGTPQSFDADVPHNAQPAGSSSTSPSLHFSPGGFSSPRRLAAAAAAAAAVGAINLPSSLDFLPHGVSSPRGLVAALLLAGAAPAANLPRLPSSLSCGCSTVLPRAGARLSFTLPSSLDSPPAGPSGRHAPPSPSLPPPGVALDQHGLDQQSLLLLEPAQLPAPAPMPELLLAPGHVQRMMSAGEFVYDTEVSLVSRLGQGGQAAVYSVTYENGRRVIVRKSAAKEISLCWGTEGAPPHRER